MIPSAAVINAGISMMRVTPLPVARAIAKAGGTLAWAVMGDRRRTLMRSLGYTAPDRSESERQRLARRTLRNMATIAVDLFKLPSASAEAVRGLFDARGLEHVDAALKLGRGAIIVTGHIGPYELASAWVAAVGYPAHGMVENLDPGVLEALARYRAATGLKLITTKDGLRSTYRVLESGELLCLIGDRAVGDTRGTVEVPFAGGIRRLPTGPATLAQATGAPILVGFASLNPRGTPRYMMEIDPPIVARGRDTAERDRLMKHIADRMGAAIRSKPDEWFVFQPDWILHEPA